MRALAVVLVACHSHAAPPPLATAGASGSPAAWDVTLARTACFGECQVYTVAIHRDGSVDWTGKQYVAAVGARHGRVAADGDARLAQAIDKVRFFELDAHGVAPRPASC